MLPGAGANVVKSGVVRRVSHNLTEVFGGLSNSGYLTTTTVSVQLSESFA